MQERNSRLPIPLSFAKFATLRSSVAAPISRVSLSISFILEKLDPSFITTPFIPLSLIRVFEPAPRIVILMFFC